MRKLLTAILILFTLTASALPGWKSDKAKSLYSVGWHIVYVEHIHDSEIWHLQSKSTAEILMTLTIDANTGIVTQTQTYGTCAYSGKLLWNRIDSMEQMDGWGILQPSFDWPGSYIVVKIKVSENRYILTQKLWQKI